MNTDRIEKKVLLQATRERVWQAISDSSQFGTWFGVAFDQPFTEGARLTGRIVPTQVDAEVARLQKPHEGKTFEFSVERIEPMNRISFRWHPYAVETGVDYSKEPTTLIVFELGEAVGGILLTIVESGFDQIPLARRAKAFAANDGGWEKQTTLIRKYLAREAAR
ncbi:MAG TPA: SRPBCC family protein [Steroidobacteraceae bacterium]|nr:SRPBCC family protein [Steroidobacteraceae bacterium]